METLGAHREELDLIAAALQERETLTDKDIHELVAPFGEEPGVETSSS
jgi:ATP-dependent Zn protease